MMQSIKATLSRRAGLMLAATTLGVMCLAGPAGAATTTGTAQLSLTNTAPATTTAGSVFDYTLTLVNKGPSTSTTTSVTDQLPAGALLYGFNHSQGSCSSAGTPAKVTCQLGPLSSGANATVTLAVALTKPGTVSDTATATNAQGSSVSSSAKTVVAAATVGQAPTASTAGATTVTASSVRLSGHVGNGNQRTGYFFEVGTTRSYGTITPVRYVSAPSDVSAVVSKLAPGTTYHYRLVAVNDTSTAYGADRTFGTTGTLNGKLLLDGRTLSVKSGRLYAKFTCDSSRSCVFRYSVDVHAKVKRAGRTATVLFLRSKTTLKTIGAGKTMTVSSEVTKAGLALLKKAAHHRLRGKLTTRPRTAQKGIIEIVSIHQK